jgi:hypothetical protein
MRPVALPQRPGFGGSGFLAIQAVSARGYVRSIAVRTASVATRHHVLPPTIDAEPDLASPHVWPSVD